MNQKPSGFESYLSEFDVVLHDMGCGEPVAWGFKIAKHLGEELFKELGKFGKLECIDGFKDVWALVTKKLSREDAIQLYGQVTEEVFGPRGGWKSVKFGDKLFLSRGLMSEKK